MRSKILYAVAVAVAFTMLQGSANAYAKFKDPGQVNAQKLEKKLWSEVKKQNWDAVQTMLAPGYQSVYVEGITDRSQALDQLKKLSLGKYKLSKFKVTKSGDTQIITYEAKAEETINGKRVTSTTPRVSVWQMTPQGWQQISHANLNH
ncbi:MAG: nuclear transport factor 2 family protein [Deltaproteobacteria bacterium]|nr:nuclear transport factor 2 family protein [Deltaproteobacteria bacterium]MDZ4225096.1 nuclear transport factor 2 family protein [bacterium]